MTTQSTTQSLPDATQPAHLTDALRRSGVLAEGHVRDVTVESSRATLLSRITRLSLAYDGPAGSAAPNSLILKTGLPERAGPAWNSGRQEVAFYTRVAAAMTARPRPALLRGVLGRGHEGVAPSARGSHGFPRRRDDLAAATHDGAMREHRARAGKIPCGMAG